MTRWWADSHVNVAAAVTCSLSDGPGRRFVLWVRRCLKRCTGCINAGYRPAGGVWRSVPEVLREVRRAKAAEDLEGLTLCGGEPFLQPTALATLARGARAAGLSVVAFTGYTMPELERIPAAGLLLAQVDLLLAGPYEAGRASEARNWVASSGKAFHFLTPRYSPGAELPGADGWVGPAARLHVGSVLWAEGGL